MGLDVHARSVVAGVIDDLTGKTMHLRVAPQTEQVVAWIQTLPGPSTGPHTTKPKPGTHQRRAELSTGVEVALPLWVVVRQGRGMGLLAAFLDLVLPQSCAGCGRARGLLCAGCHSLLLGPAGLAWPSPAPAGLPPPWSVAPYAGPVRAMIVAHKERGRTALAVPLGAALAEAVRSALRDTPTAV